MAKARLNKIELEICQRLREARENVLGYTQAFCAKQIGLDRGTYANYESGRTPLRCRVALRFCRQFIICEEWLATGQFEGCHQAAVKHGLGGDGGWEALDQTIFIRQCVDLLSDPISLHINSNALFSEAFLSILKPRFHQLAGEFFYGIPIKLSAADTTDIAVNLLQVHNERYIKLLAAMTPGWLTEANLVWRQYTRYLFECAYITYHVLMENYQSSPPSKSPRLDLLNQFLADWHKMSPEHAGRHYSIMPIAPPSDSIGKTLLTDIISSDKVLAVKPQMPELLERLKKATSERGAKTELAKFLGVRLVAVSQWLSGTKEPGGETTLRLLHWVEQQERQK